jgi:hypothetical protein
VNTYTLRDKVKGVVMMSCSDRGLLESFIENRKALGMNTDNLEITEETIDGFALSAFNRDGRKALGAAITEAMKKDTSK